MKELEYDGQAVPKGRRFCTVCGEVKRLQHFEGDSTHCDACCEKMLHTSVRWSVLPMVLFVLLAVAVAVAGLVYTVPLARQILSAQAAAQDCRLYDARYAYDDVLSSLETANSHLSDLLTGKETSFSVLEFGTRSYRNYLSVIALADSDYEAALTAADKLNADRLRKDPVFAEYKKVTDAYDTVYNEVSVINAAYPFETPEDMPFDEIIAQLDDVQAQNDSPYIKGFAEYFKVSAVQYHDPEDTETACKYLDNMLRFLPDQYVTVYATKAQIYYDHGDYDAVIEAADAVLKQNKNLTKAYEWKAEAQFKAGRADEALAVLEEMKRYCGDDPLYYKLRTKYAMRRGDLNAAEKYCTACDEANSETAETVFNAILARKTDSIPRKALDTFLHYIEYSLEEAALMLVTDDADSAFNIAYNYAFNYAYYYAYITDNSIALTQDVINITTLCACMNKDVAAAESIQEIGLCDDLTQQVIDGKYTPKEVFVEGKVELL